MTTSGTVPKCPYPPCRKPRQPDKNTRTKSRMG